MLKTPVRATADRRASRPAPASPEHFAFGVISVAAVAVIASSFAPLADVGAALAEPLRWLLAIGIASAGRRIPGLAILYAALTGALTFALAPVGDLLAGSLPSLPGADASWGELITVEIASSAICVTILLVWQIRRTVR